MLKKRYLLLLLLAIHLGLTAIPPVSSSTVVPFSFEELTQEAEVIFQGRVVQRETAEEDGMLYTWVTFEVEDVLKGKVPGRLQLRFLGADGPEAEVRVADMHLPADGEHGLYFVESVNRPLVNPLLGWSQGHFLIKENEAGEMTVQRAGESQPHLLESEETGGAETGRGRSALAAKTGEVDSLLDDFKAAIRHEVEGT